MKPKHFLAISMLLVAAGQIRQAATANEVRAVRVDSDAGIATITLLFLHTPHWKLFSVASPNRAVLDLRGTRLRGALPAAPAGNLLTGLRSGPQLGGNLRLVFDLSAPARLSASVHSATRRHPAELVVSLASASGARAGRPDGAPSGADAGAAASLTDAPARQAETMHAATPVRAAHAPRDNGRQIIVAVDAGHGGPDPGASGRGGTREKDVVLGIARALAARINREAGMRAVLTRDGDYFLTLRERIGKARKAHADMFVSVHADSVRNPAVSGASVYVLSEKGATNEQARWLAERENAADLKGGVSLDDKDPALATVLLDLSQTASLSASLLAADRVLQSLDRVGQVRKAQVLQAGFVVLKSPDIPSMLVETAYISNPQDERNLRQHAHQALLAEAIFKGVHGYFERNPPDGTRYAQVDALAEPSRQPTVLARGDPR